MKKLITITEYDIADGVKCECTSCPVARAVKRESPFFHAVGQDGITFWKGSEEKEFSIPDEVRTFIQDFDAGLRVLPFSFELDIPDEYFN